MENNKLSDALLGAGGATLWWWKQDTDDRDNRIRNNALDIRDVNRRVSDVLYSADWIRVISPTTRDVIVGTAAATPNAAIPQAVPSLVPTVLRPDLTQGNNIPFMQWPPAVGQYEADGKTAQPGELATAAFAATYQEPRAWNQGLIQQVFPSANGLTQIFLAAQGLSYASSAQNLSAAQWRSVWTTLITGVAPAPIPNPTPGPNPTTLDPHLDPAKSPTASVVLAAAVQPLNDQATGLPAPPQFKNPQTDAGNRWRITTIGGGHNAGDRLAHVTFKTEYVGKNGSGQTVSFQPIVVTSRPNFVYADNITSNGFDLVAGQALGGSLNFDVFVAVTPGLVTV